MKRYERYKASGIEWLGEIPVHWLINKISRAFDIIGSGTTPSTNDVTYYSNPQINWLNTGDLNDGIISHTSKKITQKAFDEHSSLRIYPKESVVIAMYGATIGKLGYLGIETATNQACCVINDSKTINQKYLFYFLLSSKEHIISLSYGGGQPNISQDVIKRLSIIQPSLSEQWRIARYLDYMVGRINRLVEEKERIIAKLQEKRKAIINEVITLGLVQDVPTRPSGIDWLGKIPAHWNVERVKSVVNLINDKAKDSNSKKIGLENIESKTGKYISSDSIFEGDGIEFKCNDILFGKLRPYLAKVYLAEFEGQAVGDFYVFRNKENSNPKYLSHLFISDFFISVVDGSTYGAKMPRANWDFISNVQIAIPRLDEQKLIVDYIEEKTERIDKLIGEINDQIAKIREYKMSLISEAVTGQIDLRDWQPPKTA